MRRLFRTRTRSAEEVAPSRAPAGEVARPDDANSSGLLDGSEEGFSIVEVLIAISLLAMVLLGVLRGAVASLTAASVAKEEAVASSLVSGDIAQVVGLPFSSLQAGLNPSVDSLLSDPNISLVSGNYIFNPTGATIPTTNSSSSQTPLVPHIMTVTVGIPYKVATYPTVNSSAPGLVTVTVIVSWKSPTGQTLKSVGETAVAAP